MHGSEVEARSGDVPVDYNKSTLKHVFGTGKASQVSLKREVLVRGYRFDWSRMQKELQGSKNFCG
jgi:hypothetical protein